MVIPRPGYQTSRCAVTPEILKLRLFEFEQRKKRELAAGPEPEPVNPLHWASLYRRPDGHEFSLRRFEPIRELYSDDHPHIVAIKPSQKGVSEYALNLTMFALEWGARRWAPFKDGLNVAYIFPTSTALGDFSKERISGMKRESDHMAMLLASGDFNDIKFKQVGSSYLYLRGGWSEEALESFPADVLVLDEYDRLNPKAIALARNRLNASDVARELDISTPSIPGYGIHRTYLESDRRIYEQPCPHCGAWNSYEFMTDVFCDGMPRDTNDHDGWLNWPPEEIRKSNVSLHCPECKRDVGEVGRLAPGRWRALQPAVRGIRGYWIPALAFPFVDLTKLAVESVSEIPEEVETFYRNKLGKPYDAKGSRVTEEMLLKLDASLPGGRLPEGIYIENTLGVDVGSRLHYRLSGRSLADGLVYVREMRAVSSWHELDVVMDQYGVTQCVVDALPEIHDAYEFVDRHPGKVLRAFYPSNHNFRGGRFEVDEDANEVKINRVAMCDAVYAAIATHRERWPRRVIEADEVKRHMTAPVRVVHDNAAGQPVPDWVHSAPDHFFHACVYDQVARLAMVPASAAGVLSQAAARGW